MGFVKGFPQYGIIFLLIGIGFLYWVYRTGGFRWESLPFLSFVCIMRGTMFRAEIEPMQKDDRIPRSGLWKVVIYEGERFVRTDKENMVINVAEKHAEELNYQFGNKNETKSA